MRTLREQREKRPYGWTRQPLKIEQFRFASREAADSTPPRRPLSLPRCRPPRVSCSAGCAPSSRFPASSHALPRPADEPPAGPGWIHEIKHDGFRILAHRRGRSMRLVTRNGNDLADRFPLAAEAIEAPPIRSCVVDGEAIVCDDNGLAVFDLIAAMPPMPARFSARSTYSR
jgi:hypothetical protein